MKRHGMISLEWMALAVLVTLGAYLAVDFVSSLMDGATAQIVDTLSEGLK